MFGVLERERERDGIGFVGVCVCVKRTLVSSVLIVVVVEFGKLVVLSSIYLLVEFKIKKRFNLRFFVTGDFVKGIGLKCYCRFPWNCLMMGFRVLHRVIGFISLTFCSMITCCCCGFFIRLFLLPVSLDPESEISRPFASLAKSATSTNKHLCH